MEKVKKILVDENESVVITVRGNKARIIEIFSDDNLTELKDLKEGKKFKVGNREFMVLEQSGDTTAVILSGFLHDGKNVAFGDDSNWKNSSIRKYLNREFLKELSDSIGADNIVEHTVDLIPVDGFTNYGTCKDKVSLLTFDNYRKYRKLFSKMSDWWWTVTPWAPTTGYMRYVCCVRDDGFVDCNGCGGSIACIRPFCIFKSNIFVSVVDE